MKLHTDVLVIGGGATGVGIARDLAMRGVDVTLCEANGLASGTSGRSHGLLHSGARYAESDPRGASDCLSESRVLKNIAGCCVENTSGVFVQFATGDQAYYDEKLRACESVGIPTEELSAREIDTELSQLSDGIERAFRVPDGIVWPSRLVAATAADAMVHGAEIHVNAPIEDVSLVDGEIASVYAGGDADFEISPRMVVNASGPWAEEMGELLGVDIRMQPTSGVMVSIDHGGLDTVINRCRPPTDGDIIVPHEDEVVLGTTSEPVDSPDEFETGPWDVPTVLGEGYAMMPVLYDATITRTWWGVRPLYDASASSDDGRDVSRGYTLLNHDSVGNLLSVLGGKLTIHRLMAEDAADHVCEFLGVDADCQTDEQRIRFVDDADRLDAMVRRYQAVNPTGEALQDSA